MTIDLRERGASSGLAAWAPSYSCQVRKNIVCEHTFKSCSCCGEEWCSQDSFVSDHDLRLDGYMADFECLELGLLLFTHMEDDCRSTLALHVEDFMNLYDGPVYPDRKTGGPDCPGYCRDRTNLERCNARCECAYVRELIQLLKSKNSEAPN